MQLITLSPGLCSGNYTIKGLNLLFILKVLMKLVNRSWFIEWDLWRNKTLLQIQNFGALGTSCYPSETSTVLYTDQCFSIYFDYAFCFQFRLVTIKGSQNSFSRLSMLFPYAQEYSPLCFTKFPLCLKTHLLLSHMMESCVCYKKHLSGWLINYLAIWVVGLSPGRVLCTKPMM